MPRTPKEIGRGTIAFYTGLMPRRSLLRTAERAYHVTTRANNREWFYLQPDQCWPIFAKYLGHAARRYEVHVHAFVLMSNHFHLIATTPQTNLDMFMRYYLTETCRGIQRKTDRMNHIFGGRYRWNLLGDATALAYAYKYLYRNPVRAGVCKRVEDFPYGSLPTNPANPIPISEGFDSYWALVPRRFSERLDWLNQGSEHEHLVGRALRRYEFQFTTDSNLQSALRGLHREYSAMHPSPFNIESR